MGNMMRVAREGEEKGEKKKGEKSGKKRRLLLSPSHDEEALPNFVFFRASATAPRRFGFEEEEEEEEEEEVEGEEEAVGGGGGHVREGGG